MKTKTIVYSILVIIMVIVGILTKEPQTKVPEFKVSEQLVINEIIPLDIGANNPQ